MKIISKYNNILEIGPFFNPIMKGNNVKYFDVLNQNELQIRAEKFCSKEEVRNVPFINFCSKNGDLSTVTEKFDAIVSSHVVQHQIDFINHLNQVTKLLAKDGKYFLAIPDKRYCLDHFKNETTIADIIQVAEIKPSKHSLKSLIEQRALTTHNDSLKHWSGEHGSVSDNEDKIKQALEEFRINETKGEYVKLHAWYFTPESFETIMKKLKELELITLSVEQIAPTRFGENEFFAVLSNPHSKVSPLHRSNFMKIISKYNKILEIGPFFNPIMKGNNVKYFDVLNQDELQIRAEKLFIKEEFRNVPFFIDFCSKNGDLSTVTEKFDAIVSSHVVQHQIDFINHLNQVTKLLAKDGKYFLAIPDKRYCLDHFKNETTIADIIQVAEIKPSKHSLKSLIEQRALTTHNDSLKHWSGEHGSVSDNEDTIKQALEEFRINETKEEYIDLHAWYFTPESFETIVKKLKKLELITLSVEQIAPTRFGENEFFAVLSNLHSKV